MNKILTRIVGAVAGLAMAIGAGFVIANNNKQAKPVDATAGDAPGGNWTRIVSAGDINTTDDFLIGWNYSGTDYFTNGTVTSKGLNTTSTLSSAKVVRFETATGGYYIKHTSTNYINNESSTDISLGAKSSVWTIDSDLYIVNTSNNRFLGAASASASARLKAYASSNKGSYPQVFVYKQAAEFGTLDHIKISTPATKTSYLTGETFSSSGLVLTGYDNADESIAVTQTYYSGFTTNYDGHTFARDETGAKTVTVTYSGKTVTYSINVEASPDFVHTYASNSVFGSTTYSTTETVTFTPTSGPEYITLGGYNYASGTSMSLRNTAGMYFGNNDYYKLETVKKNINKIVIKTSSDVHDKVQMTEGLTALAETSVVTPELSDSNKTLTYVFSGNNPFFKFKSTEAAYINMKEISVYLGATHIGPEVSTVSATVNDGTYYVGEKLSVSDFNLTVTWTGGKEDTHPTSEFTWTVNEIEDGALALGNNSVVVTYDGVSSDPINVVGSAQTAKHIIETTVETKSSLVYTDYSKTENDVVDTLNRSITGIEDTSYETWTWASTNSSGITYKGRSAGGNNSIQLRASDNSGVVVNANTNGRVATSITFKWEGHTAEDRILDVYGKNESYSLASELYNDSKKGTLIDSLTCSDKDANNESTLVIDGYYRYIGFRSSSGALYIESVTINWKQLNFDYTNLGIKFGGCISEALWNQLETESDIQGYGVFLSTPEYLNGDKIKDFYDLALSVAGNSEDALEQTGDGTNIKWFSNEHTDHEPELKATPTLKEGNYVWNLCKRISFANAAKNYVAVAYIKIANDVVFLDEVTANMKGLAQDLIDNDPNYNAQSFGGSLSYLANA